MLTIRVKGGEAYNERTNTFEYWDDEVLQLEHSLISISKWESKWEKVYLKNNQKTYEETVDYIRCMTINSKSVDPIVYRHLTAEQIREIHDYIEKPMTAVYFGSEKNGRRSKEAMTSELIYYWMITLQIPFECQKWHLNRLLALIRVCNMKNAAQSHQKDKKRGLSRDEIRQRDKLNEERCARLGISG